LNFNQDQIINGQSISRSESGESCFSKLGSLNAFAGVGDLPKQDAEGDLDADDGTDAHAKTIPGKFPECIMNQQVNKARLQALNRIE